MSLASFKKIIPLLPLFQFCLCLATNNVLAAEKVVVDDQFIDGDRHATQPLDAYWCPVLGIGSLKVTPLTDPPLLLAPQQLTAQVNARYGTLVGVFNREAGDATGKGAGLQLGPKEGDQLVLQLEFQFLQPAVAGTQLRIGLYNNGGTPAVTDGPGDYKNDVGYRIDLDQTGGLGRIAKEKGTDAGIGGGNDSFYINGMAGGAVPPLADQRHTFDFALTRTAQGVKISGALDGKVFNTALDGPEVDGNDDVPGLYTTFHEILLGTGAQSSNSLRVFRAKVRAVSAGEIKTSAANILAPPAAPAPPKAPAAAGAAPAGSSGLAVLISITGGLAVLALAIVVTWKIARSRPQ